MISQLLLGTTIIVVTIVIQVLFIACAIATLTKSGEWLSTPPFLVKTTISLATVVIWLVAGISLSAWLWAGVFIAIDVFTALEPAIYFSVVTFTTLGYGDITLDHSWRLLSAFTAVNGLIIFGLNTAFIVEFISRLRSSQEQLLNEENQ